MRRDLRRTLGHDLPSVRVHTDSRAADSAAAVGARAYTVGTHVVLGHGESLADRGLMVHEPAGPGHH
jgi:hypothetical protein